MTQPPYTATTDKGLHLTIESVGVKARKSEYSTLLLRGTITSPRSPASLPYEAAYDLREGNSCDGTVNIAGIKAPPHFCEQVLMALGTALDEANDETLQQEMTRICGE